MTVRWRDADGNLIPEFPLEGFAPLEEGGMRLDHLLLREPKGIHVKRAESELKTGTPEQVRAYQIRLVSEVSGVKVTLVQLLPIGIINEASAYLQAFVEAGLDNGKTSPGS